jgi:hypothetical protein
LYEPEVDANFVDDDMDHHGLAALNESIQKKQDITEVHIGSSVRDRGRNKQSGAEYD